MGGVWIRDYLTPLSVVITLINKKNYSLEVSVPGGYAGLLKKGGGVRARARNFIYYAHFVC
jgi:hypothetical protein